VPNTLNLPSKGTIQFATSENLLAIVHANGNFAAHYYGDFTTWRLILAGSLMIKIKPPRYQTLIERSITARGFGTEKHYVIDSRTNARIVKCRNQQESDRIAARLNAAAKFRWVKLPSD
jgi:hypothetical protein